MRNKIDLVHRPNSKSFRIDQRITGKSGNTFIIDEKIGHGGNAVVYKCYDEFSGEIYAVKFLLDKKNIKKKRFLFERECMEKCQHPHIIKHIDHGSIKASWWHHYRKRQYYQSIEYIIMEYAEQGSLRDWLVQHTPVEPEVYTAQFRGLSKALAHLHTQDILHRDIKPENILVVNGRWVLSDFGLSTNTNRANRLDLTKENEKVGPMFWMSPEATNKCLGINTIRSKISKCSDVFQLASIFWFVVNKHHPSGILRDSHWKGRKDIFPICAKALQHDPRERYQDGASLYDAFDKAV